MLLNIGGYAFRMHLHLCIYVCTYVYVYVYVYRSVPYHSSVLPPCCSCKKASNIHVQT